MKRKEERRWPIDLANPFMPSQPSSNERWPIALEVRYPIGLKKVGRKRKADKFLTLSVEVQNQAIVAAEIIERVVDKVVRRKELEIRFDWWRGVLNRAENVQNAILHEIGKCLSFCSSKKTDIEVYSMFASRIAKKAQISAPGKCLNDPAIRSAFVRLLSKDCGGDVEKLKAILAFYDYFQEKQVEVNGMVTQPFVAIETKYRVKRCMAFESIVEVIDYCIDEDMGYLWYIDFKVAKYMEAFDNPNRPFTLYLKNLTNEHFRPMAKDYAKVTQEATELLLNPWGEIILYLGLSADVQFVDGSIPVGFEMSVEHLGRGGKMTDIVSVNREGYYYTRTGDRFKGQRHHQVQNLHVLSCTSENFLELKERWWDSRQRKKPAKSDDLKQWGLFKDKLNIL